MSSRFGLVGAVRKNFAAGKVVAFHFFQNQTFSHDNQGWEYDTLSANVVKSFPKLAKSESGQIVSEKVKLTYFDVYLSHTMWNHTKNSMKGLKQPTLVFLQWEVADWQELFAKNAPNKGN